MSDTVEVALRKGTGTKECRRLRRSGHVPAVLYGHGEKCVDLSAPREAVHATGGDVGLVDAGRAGKIRDSVAVQAEKVVGPLHAAQRGLAGLGVRRPGEHDGA